jgi:hypothetical protein
MIDSPEIPRDDEKRAQNPNDYKVVISKAAEIKIEAYLHHLKEHPEDIGDKLKAVLANENIAINQLSKELLIDSLLKSKIPKIFAESPDDVTGDSKTWNKTELSILGDINITMNVDVYDNGNWFKPTPHEKPFSAGILYTPGALLKNKNSPDLIEIVKGGKVDKAAMKELYQRRLLPLLYHANQECNDNGQKDFVTVPGLGCGEFAGSYKNEVVKLFPEILKEIINENKANLPHISGYLCAPEPGMARSVDNGPPTIILDDPFRTNLLSHPASYGEQFKDCKLYKVVAWDHVSWPGNDFYEYNTRNTDDGVSAAATNTIGILTGIQGTYKNGKYMPPEGYRDWQSLIKDKQLNLTSAGRLNIVAATKPVSEIKSDAIIAPTKPPLEVTSELLEEFNTRFYEGSPDRKTGTSDIGDFIKKAQEDGKDKNQINIAKMLLLAEIVSERRDKRVDEQITFFTGPLNAMFREADTPDADPSFKLAADKIRQDQFLISKIISIHSNSLTELSAKMKQYNDHFSTMETDFKRDKEAILAENPKLAENNNLMYDKTLESIKNMADIYRNKLSVLSDDEKVILDKLINKSPLSTQEYDKGIAFLSQLVSFDNTHVSVLTESASIYQALLSINALKSTTDAILKTSVYSELFQAAMRHRNMMEKILEDAEVVQRATNTGISPAVETSLAEEAKVVEPTPIEQGSHLLESTKNELNNLNYSFRNNFMLDNIAVRDLTQLNQLIMKDKKNTYKIDPKTKDLISSYAQAMEKFSNANYNYYIDKNSIHNQKQLEEAFTQLNAIHIIINTPENRKRLLALSDTPLFGEFYNISKKQLQEVIPLIIDEGKNGLFTYLRVFDFEEFKKRSIDECKEKLVNLPDTANSHSKILDALVKLAETIPDNDKSKMEWINKLDETKTQIDKLQDEVQKNTTLTDELKSSTDEPKAKKRSLSKSQKKNLKMAAIATATVLGTGGLAIPVAGALGAKVLLKKQIDKRKSEKKERRESKEKIKEIENKPDETFLEIKRKAHDRLTLLSMSLALQHEDASVDLVKQAAQNVIRANSSKEVLIIFHNLKTEGILDKVKDNLDIHYDKVEGEYNWRLAQDLEEIRLQLEAEEQQNNLVNKQVDSELDSSELNLDVPSEPHEADYAATEARYNEQLAQSLEDVRRQVEDEKRQHDLEVETTDLNVSTTAPPIDVPIEQSNKTPLGKFIIAKARALANENKVQSELRSKVPEDVKDVTNPSLASDRTEVAQVHHKSTQKLYLKLERMKGVAGELDKYGIKDFAQETDHVKIDMFTSEGKTIEIQAKPMPDTKGDTYSVPNNIMDEEKKIAIQNICKLAVATAKPGTEFNIPATDETQRKMTEDALNDALSKKFPGIHQPGVFKIPEASVCILHARLFAENKDYDNLAQLIHLSLFHEKLGTNGNPLWQINPKELSTLHLIIEHALNASNNSCPELSIQRQEFNKFYNDSNLSDKATSVKDIADIPVQKLNLTMFHHAVQAARETSHKAAVKENVAVLFEVTNKESNRPRT